MTPSEAANRLHWVKFNKDTNTIELYLDHFMLSGLRLCEARFFLDHVMWVKPRYDSAIRKPWFLDFGEFLHYCTEIFYAHFKYQKQPPVVDEWINKCKKKWDEMNMDAYEKVNSTADQKKYEDVGGWEGVAGLLIEYYAYYMSLRVRVIDTEITFGHNKEVLIGKWMGLYKTELEIGRGKIKRLGKPKLQEVPMFVECYLTGRIDLLIDNGYKIGPVDHKSTHKFDGYEHEEFNPQDGITGYILAINNLLRKYRDAGLVNVPVCNDGWIYHISNCRPSVPKDKTKKQGPRFKNTPIGKTIGQLEEYKARQLSTFKRVADLLFNDKTPEWNTLACHNIFFRHCEYKPIHEQPSVEWANTIKQFYTIGQNIWDTRSNSLSNAYKTGPSTNRTSNSTAAEENAVLTTASSSKDKE